MTFRPIPIYPLAANAYLAPCRLRSRCSRIFEPRIVRPGCPSRSLESASPSAASRIGGSSPAQGRYLDDDAPEGCLHALVLRSPHAHARFAVTDLAAARAIPGVRLVLTARRRRASRRRSLPGAGAERRRQPGASGAHPGARPRHGAPRRRRHRLRRRRRRCARHGTRVEAIAVDYEVLPAIVDLRGAIRGTARRRSGAKPRTTSPSIRASATKPPSRRPSRRRRRGVAIAIENNRLITNFMETRGVVASLRRRDRELHPDARRARASTSLRDTLANQVLKVDPSEGPGDHAGRRRRLRHQELHVPRIRARAPKPRDALERPVKWVADRTEHFIGDAQGRDNFSTGEMALDADGRFLAMRFDIIGESRRLSVAVRALTSPISAPP